MIAGQAAALVFIVMLAFMRQIGAKIKKLQGA